MKQIDLDNELPTAEQPKYICTKGVTPLKLARKIKGKQPLIESNNRLETGEGLDIFVNKAYFILNTSGYSASYWLTVGEKFLDRIMEFIYWIRDDEEKLYNNNAAALNFCYKPLFHLVNPKDIEEGLYLISDISQKKVAYLRFDYKEELEKAFSENAKQAGITCSQDLIRSRPRMEGVEELGNRPSQRYTDSRGNWAESSTGTNVRVNTDGPEQDPMPDERPYNDTEDNDIPV